MSTTWFACIVAVAASTTLCAQTPFPLSSPVIGQYSSLTPLGPTHAAADFNGDGREDVVAAFAGYLGEILSVPAGGYGPGTAIAAWPGVQTGWVDAVGDLTADGNQDIVASFFFFSSGSTTSYLYPGLGNGQFLAPAVLPDPSGFAGAEHHCFVNHSVPGVTVPGGPPALVLCTQHTVPVTQLYAYTLSYQGGSYSIVGTKFMSAPPALGSNAIFQFWKAGDINGDGLLDLVGSGTSTFLQWDWVVSFGTMSPPYFSDPVVVSAQFPLAANFDLADVNNDGMDDVIGRKPGAVIAPLTQAIDAAVYFGNAVAPLSQVIVSATGVASGPYTVVEDFDGDGARDLIMTITPQPGQTVWGIAFSRGDGQGHFSTALTLQSPPVVSSATCAAADADGNGLRDVVGFQGSPNTFVLYNQAKIGSGIAGGGGLVPQTTAGVATPGNPFYHVGVIGAASSSTAILGVSLGIMPGPDPWGIMLDTSSLVLPVGQLGVFPTDATGQAIWSLSLPPPPTLVGQTVYLQWGVIDSLALNGYSLTPARKIVFW